MKLKRENRTHSGDGAEDKPKWILYDELKFLDSSTVAKASFSNLENEEICIVPDTVSI